MWEYRLARGYGLIKLKKTDTLTPPYNKNRSFCDGCGRQLKWYENIPVFSWIIQKGKTRCCHKKLSITYPIVELLTGILFLLFFWIKVFPNLMNGLAFNIPGVDFSSLRVAVELFVYLLIIVCLVLSSIFDLKYMILPDISTGILIGCGIVLLIFGGVFNTPLLLLISGLTAFGFLGILYLVTKGKGMGLGDVKFAFFMGLFLGWQRTIIAFYLAFIVGAIVGIFLIVLKKAKKNSAIPFGPFLILGTFFAWWWGDYLLNFVYKWF